MTTSKLNCGFPHYKVPLTFYIHETHQENVAPIIWKKSHKCLRAGVCRPCVETELTATKKSATDGN